MRAPGDNDAETTGLLVCLEIPDIYERDEPELVRTLEQRLYEHLMQEGLL